MCEPDPVAEALAAALARGFEIEPATAAFIDATFPDPSPEGLAAALREESHPDAAGLAALLFTAEESLQLEIEPLRRGRRFGPGDEEAIVNALARPGGVVACRFADGRGELALEVTAERARQLVSSLALGRSLPEEIDRALDALDRGAAAVPAARVRLALRRLRVRWTAPFAAFARTLISALPIVSALDLEQVEYALGAAADAPDPGADPLGALGRRRELLAAALFRGRRQEALCAALPLEVVASRGLRVIAVDAAETQRRIAALDRVLLALTGRLPGPVVHTEVFGRPPD